MKPSFLILNVVILLGSPLSYAQLGAPAPLPEVAKAEGPSMEQTTAWIVNKINTMPAAVRNRDDAGEPTIVYGQVSRVFIDGCTMMSGSIQNSGTRILEHTGSMYATVGPIEELDGDHFEILTYGYNDKTPLARLAMNTLGKRKVFQSPVFAFHADITDPNLAKLIIQNIKAPVMNGNPVMYPPANQSGTGFVLPDMETAQSVGNAFKHLAMLCRQKIAAEKAAIPAKPKDLF